MGRTEDGKYLIYLDQNILQYDFEKKMTVPEIDQVQWVYSDEHFNEIKRWERPEFFDVLARIGARKLKIQLDENFQLTDDARLLDFADPKEMYDEYLETIDEYRGSMTTFAPMQVFLNGNTKSISPEDIADGFKSSLMSLLDIQDTTPEIQAELKKMTPLLDSMADELKVLFDGIRDQIPPLEASRKKLLGSSLSLLKKDDGPVIDQIWERLDGKMGTITKDQLFGKEPLPDTNQESMPMFLSVIQCHTILNYLGYHPDQGLAKVSKIFGINSDASHLAHSAFCAGLMSGDKRLCKKAEAIFDYFGYSKTIYQIEGQL